MATIFLDSNIFLYAVGADEGLRGPCGSILQAAAEGSIDATTNSEVIQEILHVLRRKGRHADALLVARRVGLLFPDLLPVTQADMARVIDILAGDPTLPTRDAVHAATMRGAGISHIVTADRDFDRVAGVVRLEPRDFPWPGV